MNETQRAIWARYEAKVRDVAVAIESVRRRTSKKHPIASENREKLNERYRAEERSCCHSGGCFKVSAKHMKSALHCSHLYGADAGRVWGISNRITRQMKKLENRKPEYALLDALVNIFDEPFAHACLSIKNPGDAEQIREAEERIILFGSADMRRNPTRELLRALQELDEKGRDEKEVLEAVGNLLREGANPDARWESGYSPLHIAIYDQRLPFVRALIEGGANLDLRDAEGKTPLHLAVSRFPKVIPLLLEAGADPNARDAYGMTLLHHSEVYDDETIEYLIAGGADSNARSDNGRTPLHNAISSRNISKASLLLRAGSDPNAQDNNGYTPLISATGTSIEAIKLLLAAGADPTIQDDDGCQPEDYANPNDEERAILVAAREARELEQSASEGRGNADRRRRI